MTDVTIGTYTPPKPEALDPRVARAHFDDDLDMTCGLATTGAIEVGDVRRGPVSLGELELPQPARAAVAELDDKHEVLRYVRSDGSRILTVVDTPDRRDDYHYVAFTVLKVDGQRVLSEVHILHLDGAIQA